MSDARCLDCGKEIYDGDQCGACARKLWTGWVGLIFLGLGIPLAAVGFAFAYSMAKASGFAIYLLWMIGGLGLVAAPAGLIDLVRALRARARGERDPRPWATKWIMNQLNL